MAVVVGVESCEESLGVGLHFIDRQHIVVVAVGLVEPGRKHVVAGRMAGRTTAEQIVLYKSVGSAVQDLAVADMCVRAAKEAGIGAELPIHIKPVEK